MKLTKLQRNIFECLEQGLTTKEIMEKLSCSEDSVKQTRANKELKAFYDSQKAQKSAEREREEIKEVVLLMIDTMREISKNPASSLDARLTASKQLIELRKMLEEQFPAPKEKRTIEIKYVGAKPWQLQEKAKLEIERNKENIIAEIKAEMCEVCER